MLYLDYLAHNNTLKNISIGEKLLLGGGGLVLSLILSRPSTLLAVFLAMHIVMLYARIPLGYLGRLWLAPLTFLLIGIGSVLVSISSSPFTALAIIHLGGYYLGVTPASLVTAQAIFLRSLAAVSCLLMIATTTPVSYIVTYLSRIPGTSTIAEIAYLSYRFIFVFLAAAGQIYTAQQSRLGYADTRKSLTSLALLAANVGQKTFLTARDLTIALNARNYRDQLSFYYPIQTASPVRLLLILLVLIGLALTALV